MTDTISPFLEQIPFLAMLLDRPLLLGLSIAALTAALLGMGVPGVTVPLSFSAGALLGGWEGTLVVGLGAVLGSQVFFMAIRRFTGARVRERLGDKLKRFDNEFAKRGLLYVIGLRLAGAPHFLVTGGSALSPMPGRNFALATLIGIAPAVMLAATAGSAI